MATINLRKFYPFYNEDYFIEVSDEIAAELEKAERLERNYIRRHFYNKAHYSLDADDGIETAAIYCCEMSPWAVVEMMDRHCRLCQALNSLPEIQGRRIEAHYIFGKSQLNQVFCCLWLFRNHLLFWHRLLFPSVFEASKCISKWEINEIHVERAQT